MDERLERIRRAHEEEDREISVILSRSNKPVTCQRGCSACCYEPVFAEKREAELAFEVLKQMPLGDMDYVVKQMATWLQKVQEGGGNVKMLDAFEWRRLEVPCPFLRKNECMIYADRPFGCRAFMAAGPRENCENLDLRPQQMFLAFENFSANPILSLLDGKSPIELDHFGCLLAEAIGGEEVISPFRQRVIL